MRQAILGAEVELPHLARSGGALRVEVLLPARHRPPGEGILDRVLRVEHDEAGDLAPPAPQDAAEALDHLAAAPGRGHDDAEIGVRHVDALVEDARRRDRIDRAVAEQFEPFLALLVGHARVHGGRPAAGGAQDFRGLAAALLRLREDDGPRAGPHGGGEALERQRLHARPRQQGAAVGEPGQVAAGETTARGGLPLLGQPAHLLQEFAHRFGLEAMVLDQPLTDVEQGLLQLVVGLPFVTAEGHGGESDLEGGDELVGGGPLIAHPEADRAEVVAQDAVTGVSAGQRRRQAQPPRVLGAQRP